MKYRLCVQSVHQTGTGACSWCVQPFNQCKIPNHKSTGRQQEDSYIPNIRRRKAFLSTLPKVNAKKGKRFYQMENRFLTHFYQPPTREIRKRYLNLSTSSPALTSEEGC